MKLLPRIIIAELVLALALVTSGDATTVERTVRDWLMDTYDLDTASSRIEVLADPFASEEIDAGQIDVTALTQTKPIGLFTVLVTVNENGELKERGQVRLRIRKYAEVLVASDKIKRHDLLTDENVVLTRTEVTSLREQPVQSLEELDNCRSKRNIRRGQIITTMAVEPVPDIEVGREVTIVVSNDVLTITAPGKALQSGSHGDYVRVKNKATGKILKARVLDENQVAVDL